MKVSFVIPALNEEGVVGKTIRSIPVKEIEEAGYTVEIIVVNNNSTDNTAQEASDAGATVFLEEDTIKAATLDELTYLSKEEYSGLITALETTTHKHIASKVENSEAYSKAIEISVATNTIK